MSVVQFDVAYRLSEYRAFVLDHFATVTHKQPGFFTTIFVSAVAAVTFAVKKYKMPLCSFSIDEGGIRRRTKVGDICVPWSEVAAIHNYSRGFLIEKSHGAMPIPYRCLNEEQRLSLQALVTAWEIRRGEP